MTFYPAQPLQQDSEPRWRVVSASVTGVSHAKVGMPCQDRNTWCITKNGILVAAVADGAGSASLGDVGAQIACTTGVATLAARMDAITTAPERLPWQYLLEEALTKARAAVEQEAEARSVPARELATTLIIVAAARDWIALAQVGDGAAIFQTGDDRLIALTTFPETNQDNFVNQTVFLTSPDAREHFQTRFRLDTVAYVGAFSDGLERLALKLPEGKPHAPFFAPLFRFVGGVGENADEQLAAFLCSPRINERADDDLTLFLAMRIANNE